MLSASRTVWKSSGAKRRPTDTRTARVSASLRGGKSLAWERQPGRTSELIRCQLVFLWASVCQRSRNLFEVNVLHLNDPSYLTLERLKVTSREPAAEAERLCPRAGEGFGAGSSWAAGAGQTKTGVHRASRCPGTGLSEGGSQTPGGSRPLLQPVPALSGRDSAAAATHCKRRTRRRELLLLHTAGATTKFSFNFLL